LFIQKRVQIVIKVAVVLREEKGERGWWGVSSGKAWNLVALGVHALLVGDIVAPL
jgi:hypothetical protein